MRRESSAASNMATTIHDCYLESKVFTAPPHQLQLLLIEAAIRFGRQADEAMRRDDRAAASAPLLRVIDIVGELLAAVRGSKSDLNRKIADFYWFLFRLVSEAKINDDVAKLSEALQLLEFERETWQLVCEKFGSEIPRTPFAPVPTDSVQPLTKLSSSFSLEA